MVALHIYSLACFRCRPHIWQWQRSVYIQQHWLHFCRLSFVHVDGRVSTDLISLGRLGPGCTRFHACPPFYEKSSFPSKTSALSDRLSGNKWVPPIKHTGIAVEVSSYFEPSQPQRITSRPKTMFSLSPIYSARKLSNHKLSPNHNISPDTNPHRTKIKQTSNTKLSKN